jgi:hypothetical protein
MVPADPRVGAGMELTRVESTQQHRRAQQNERISRLQSAHSRACLSRLHTDQVGFGGSRTEGAVSGRTD